MSNARTRLVVSTLVVGLFGGFALTGCGRSDPPPDLIKSQREDMDKAKAVEQTIMKQDEAARKATDDASK